MSDQFVKGDNLELALASFRLDRRGIILLTPMVAPTKDANGNLLTEAREYGRYLAEMLAASHFSVEEKQAWAALIPDMIPEQLAKLDAILKADINKQANAELEDLLVIIRAAEHKRDLSLAALRTKTHDALADIQKDINAAD